MKHSLRNDARSLWDYRDMRLVMPARALSFLGDAMALVALALRTAQGNQPLRLTVLFAAFALPLFLLAPWAGRIVDEHDSRKVLTIGGCVQVLGSLGLVLAPDFTTLVAAVVVLQVGQSVTQPGWSALVPRIVGDAVVGTAMGIGQALSALAGLAGSAAGGVIYGLLGYRGTILVDTATFAVLTLVGLSVRTRRGHRNDHAAARASGHSTRDTPMSGWRYCRTDQVLRLLVPALWLLVIAAEAQNVVEVFLIRNVLGASAAAYGLTGASFMLGTIAGPLLASHVHHDRTRIMGSSLATAAIGAVLVLIGLSPTVWLVGGLLTAGGVCFGAFETWIGTVVLTRPPDHIRGRVEATINGTMRGCTILAMALGGVLGATIGPRATYVACGGLVALVAPVLLNALNGLPAAATEGARADA
jgi:MFS family permease